MVRLTAEVRRATRWHDPIRRGWPGPVKDWTPEQKEVFARAYAEVRDLVDRETLAYAHAYGAVTLMPEGRDPDVATLPRSRRFRLGGIR